MAFRQSVPRAQNLQAWSSDLTKPPWAVQAGAGAPTYGVAAPDGTLTASRLDISGCAVGNGVYATSTTMAFGGRTISLLVWMRSNTGVSQTIMLADAVTVGGAKTVTVTTSWQMFKTTFPGGVGAGPWVRKAAGTTGAIDFYCINIALGDVNDTHTTTGTADAVSAAARSVVPQAQNLIATTDLSTATWSAPTAMTRAAAATTGYLGGATAREFLETAANSGHSVGHTPGSLNLKRRLVTLTAFLKYDGRQWIALGDGTTSMAFFDIQNGAKGSKFTAASAGLIWRIDPMANGFYRCQVVGPMRSDTSFWTVSSATADGVALPSYAGDITKGFILDEPGIAIGNVVCTNANTTGTADPISAAARSLA